MPVETHVIQVETAGHNEVRDLSADLQECLRASQIRNGLLTIFVTGSTAGITTTEYEPGLAKHDLHHVFEKIAPQDGHYQHEATWHDDNGHSHVRAALLGPGLTIPLSDGTLTLGTWQQVVLIDFDTRPRDRKLIVQIMGE